MIPLAFKHYFSAGHDAHRIGLLVSILALSLWSPESRGQITDAGSYPPPVSGPYGYNNFTPNTAGFPNAGQSYVDPVFGTTITRMTDTVGEAFFDNIYAFHRSNADGTMLFAEIGQDLQILDTETAEILYADQPAGTSSFEIYWDALDPNIYYFLSNSRLMRRNLAAQTSTVMKDFGTRLQTNGGSLNVQSADGRYFTVRYNGTNKLWDSQLDVVYSGSVAPDGGSGWVSITPNASHFVTADAQQVSYEINHDTQSIDSNGKMFWNLCGDHGVLVSATDGKSYFVTMECFDESAVYRVDLSIDQAGRSPEQQRADNLQLFDLTWNDDIHLSAVSRGIYRDWVFIDTEELRGNDNFDTTPTGWTPYRSEIVATNVVTGEVRRLAHHRSRNISSSYYYQPRVSSSWDGSVVMWTSNMNRSDENYNDIYIIRNPLGAAEPVKKPAAIDDLQNIE